MNGKPWIAQPTPSEWFIQHGSGSYEMNFANVGTIVTPDDAVPNNRFYVHNRSMPPDINVDEWVLQIHGDAVASPMNLSFSDVKAMPRATARYVLDCGANGRSFFPKLPPPSQAQGWLPVGFTDWRWGAMGAAEWEGVLLSDVLARCGIDPTTAYIRLQGHDHVLQGDGSHQRYSHVFNPGALANVPVILAYTMNNAPLPRDHGHPLRAVVPGQGGNVSVKWLVEIYASNEPIPWIPLQNNQMLWGPDYDPPQPPPPMMPKSAFELGWDGTITLKENGQPVTLFGRAWNSNSTIAQVEVAVDQMQNDGSWQCIIPWQPATLLSTPQPNWWVRFSWTWDNPQPGAYKLFSRATDTGGNAQPDPAQLPWNQHGLHYNATAGHPVTVMPLGNMP